MGRFKLTPTTTHWLRIRNSGTDLYQAFVLDASRYTAQRSSARYPDAPVFTFEPLRSAVLTAEVAINHAVAPA
jgi:hypothetical protein